MKITLGSILIFVGTFGLGVATNVVANALTEPFKSSLFGIGHGWRRFRVSALRRRLALLEALQNRPSFAVAFFAQLLGKMILYGVVSGGLTAALFEVSGLRITTPWVMQSFPLWLMASAGGLNAACVAILAAYGATITGLLSDLSSPKMTARKLEEKLQKLDPSFLDTGGASPDSATDLEQGMKSRPARIDLREK